MASPPISPFPEFSFPEEIQRVEGLIRQDDLPSLERFLHDTPDPWNWSEYRSGNSCPPLWTAICLASRRGSISVLKLLLAQDIPVQLADPTFDPGPIHLRALHEACASGQLEIVRFLIGECRGQPTDVPTMVGTFRRTALMSAVDRRMFRRTDEPCDTFYPKQETVIHYLLDQGGDVQDTVFLPLDGGSIGWNGEAEGEVPETIATDNILTLALEFASAGVLRRLINAGADIHALLSCGLVETGSKEGVVGKVTPLHFACQYRNLAGVALLLEAGGDGAAGMVDRRDAVGATPLHWAADDGILCDDTEGWVPRLVWNERHLSKCEKKRACIELLLSHGGPQSTLLDAQDNHGTTALHHAVRLRSVDLALYLLEKGANPNLKDEMGSTPLHLRLRYEQPAEEELEAFFRYGFRLDAADAEGNTLLHLASRRWRWGQTVQWLLHHGADAGVANKKGQLPLHLAAGSLCDGLDTIQVDDDFDGLHRALTAQDQMIQLLQDSGAGTRDMDTPDAGGITPQQALAATRSEAYRTERDRARRRAQDNLGAAEKAQYDVGSARLPAAVQEVLQRDMRSDAGAWWGLESGHVSLGRGWANMSHGTGSVVARTKTRRGGYLGVPPFRLERLRGLSLEQGGSVVI